MAYIIAFILFANLCFCFTAEATNKDLAQWLEKLRREARSQGVSAATLDLALKDFSPSKRVLQLDRRQPEKTQTFNHYLTNVVPTARVSKGRSELERHYELLEEIADRYRVQPRFIIALWAIESDFGRNMGQTPVIDALATLAYDGRRSTYFRKELLIALHILDEGHIPSNKMIGSWAGAMGQCQFMPWNFKRRAVDFDGDGRRDIWHTQADVFASIANFLKSVGWHDDQTWGREIILPPEFDKKLIGLKTQKSLAQWQKLGVRRLNETALPKRDLQASLVRPGRGSGRVFLIYDNYRTLLKWNNSNYFALAVGALADRLKR